ncbi:MAG TPA: peptidoglycan DD-metalloendopeptidase family protein [Leptolyngbyaceae cyanobacterium]
MKRALTQKVNRIPACEVDNFTMVESLKPIPPEVNRRARTSAAMIGLAISMGASSLLIPQQGDGAMAAEPTTNSPLPTLPSVPAEAASVVGQQVKSAATAAAITPEAQPVNQAEETGAAKPLVQEHKVREWQPTAIVTGVARQSIVLPEIASTSSHTNNQVAVGNDRQVSNYQPKTINQIGHDIKADNLVATASDSSYGVVSNQLEQSAATEASTALPVSETTANSENLNDLLKAKQAVAINRLKESSNRLRSSLAEWKSEESVISSVRVNEQNAPVAVAGELKPTTGQTNAALGMSDWQPKVAAVEPAIVKAPEVREATVIPQPVLPVVASVYQVKPGDTIDAIARNYGVPAPILAKANNLDNPDRIQVSQLIAIPPQSTNLATGTWQAGSDQTQPYQAEPVSPSFAARNLSSASAKANLPIVTALAPNSGTEEIGVPTVPPSNWTPATASTTSVSSLGTDAVPPSYKGARYQVPTEILKTKQVAGNADRKNLQLTPAPGEPSLFNPDETPNRGPQANSKQQSNPYVERLRAEIMQLREQYRHHQSNDTLQRLNSMGQPDESNSTPKATPPNSAADARSLSNSSNPANSEYDPDRYNEALQGEIQRRQQAKPNNRATAQATVPERALVPNRREQVVATAPLGPEVYQPYNQTAPGMVAPQLPPLDNPENYLPGGVNQNFNGYIWPARGVLTSGYGWRWGRMHKGIDIAAPTGTPIFASAPGVVIYARWNSGGYGNLVDIKHADGSVTRYAHNSRIFVQEGQVVEQGQHISAMGSTGYSTGPHLHFEVHPSGRGAVNPMAFLPRNQARR